MRSRQKAFSLVELLVVIAVIGILASLMLTTLARARSCGQLVACSSNLRQIAIAGRLYVDDFGKYPPFGPALNQRDGFWDFQWLVYASGNTNNTKLFLCPSNRKAAQAADGGWSGEDAAGNIMPNASYAYNGRGTRVIYDRVAESANAGMIHYLGLGNQWLAFTGMANDPCLPESSVLEPSDMVMVCDFDLPRTEDDGDGDLHPSLAYLAISGRHSAGANALFCDSHIEFGKTNRWHQGSDRARARWNHDHQPHRG